MAVSSKPLGGAPLTPLRVKPLSAPKTIKRSLATLNDIFTSVMETPTVVSSRDAGQNNRRNVAARPAEEVAATDSTAEKHILSMDASESNHETPQDSKRQSENT